ncbi:MAG: vitamin B12 dependent-methionine synthase activation domain-containing protein [Candidatus Marinimicrobia bacterium]|nr:vitamin B12 dependent-methionine synthase activation domain-containing protein [Candidatus Neomarinimicrobiota bacterium]
MLRPIRLDFLLPPPVPAFRNWRKNSGKKAMITVLCCRKYWPNLLAEALSGYLHQWVIEEWWKPGNIPSIRPAVGYPSAADHSEKGTIFTVLNAEKHTGVSLSENFAMDPPASVCGYYFAGKDVHNFSPGPLGEDQLRAYAQRKGISKEFLRKVLAAGRDHDEDNRD